MRAKAGLWLRRALGVGLLLGAWQLASLYFPPLVVPPIPQVVATLVNLFQEPDFWPTVGTTLLRLAAGLAIGIGAGGVLGLIFGLCPKLEDVGTPMIHVLQSVPPVCWVVLALVWFGFNGLPCIFIVATATVPTVVINLSHGVRSVDRELLEMAKLYRFSHWKTPAPCDPALHPALLQLRPGNRDRGRMEAGGDGRGAHHQQRYRRGHHLRPAQCAAGRHHRLGVPAGGRLFSHPEAAAPAVLQEGGSGMLKLTGIQKSFDGLPVLSNLSLTLSQGEIVALIGPSGCGKTTLLNIISGLTAPDAGTVEGAEVKLSYMFQNARLLPWRTVEENMRLVREDAPGEEVRALIAAVGLEGFEHYYPGQLSGGMARRCALARAFHFGGSLFLMDEPFQGLDYGIRMEMVEMLLTMWRREKPGVLFVTHEIDEALTVATRIAVLTPRPTTIQTWYTLPGAEGREASAPELLDLRREIIRQITG